MLEVKCVEGVEASTAFLKLEYLLRGCVCALRTAGDFNKTTLIKSALNYFSQSENVSNVSLI